MELPDNLPTTVYLAGHHDGPMGPTHRSAQGFFSSAATALRHGFKIRWNEAAGRWVRSSPTYVLKGTITWEVEEQQ